MSTESVSESKLESEKKIILICNTGGKLIDCADGGDVDRTIPFLIDSVVY
jgi:hypothetical protein